MAIKMRNNLNEDAICCECGETQKQVLNMYDICIGGIIHTICDRCIVDRNGRVKSSRDIMIINKRNQIAYDARKWERYAAGRQTKVKD